MLNGLCSRTRTIDYSVIRFVNAGTSIGGLTLAAAAISSNRFWFSVSQIHVEFRYNDRL